MSANTAPIYTATPAIGLAAGTGIGTSVITDYDGTGGNNVLVFTADATNGSYIQRLRFKAKGTNAVSVARIFINNGTTVGTATNNSFYGEVSLPATTSSTTVGTNEIDYPMAFAIPAGYKLYVGISAASGLASGWSVTTIAGNY